MNRGVPLLIALCVLALAPTAARADVGPPAGKKLVPVTTIVEATEMVTDYAFFEVSYSSTPGPPPHGGSSRSVTLHFFAAGTTIKATGARRSGGSLYAVPRTVAERFPAWSEFVAEAANRKPPAHATLSTSDTQWFALAQSVLDGEVAGGIAIPFGTTEELPVSDPREAITVNYRITRGSAGLAFVRPGERRLLSFAGVDDPPAEVRAPFPWKWVAAGGAGFAAILLGGLWLVLRIRKAA
jgi:hypothetical protein